MVVIVVAGYSGKRFIYERAQELGIRWGFSWHSPVLGTVHTCWGLHGASCTSAPWKFVGGGDT